MTTTKTSTLISPYGGRLVDLMTVPENRIKQINVLMTMVGGKVVYRHGDFAQVSTQ